jgi:hypothetical protein
LICFEPTLLAFLVDAATYKFRMLPEKKKKSKKKPAKTPLNHG